MNEFLSMILQGIMIMIGALALAIYASLVAIYGFFYLLFQLTKASVGCASDLALEPPSRHRSNSTSSIRRPS